MCDHLECCNHFHQVKRFISKTLTILNTMESEIEIAKNQVQRKIGRNIVAFQKVEQMLKYLIVNGKFSGCISEIDTKRKQRAGIVERQTLGQLVGQYLNQFHSGYEQSNEEPEDLKEVYISFYMQVDRSEKDYENKKQILASMVAERNELIHHLLPRFDWNSMESCQDTDRYLDQQYKKLLLEFKDLKALTEAFQKARVMCADFFDSEEGKKYLEWLWCRTRYRRVSKLLIDIANKAARPDGWTLLSVAGQLLHQQEPEELAVLKEKNGHKTLKEVIMATGQFDIKEEQTEKGGVRVLYRPKSD